MRVKSSGLAPGLANALPPGSAKFANTTSPGLTRRATAPLRSSPGGGGGRGVLGAAGIDCCIMHMAGYFEVISFLILPVFNFLILFNKKTKTKKGQLSYIMLFSRLHQAYLQSWVKPNAQTLFLDFGETAFRRVLFSRFQQANMNKGY